MRALRLEDDLALAEIADPTAGEAEALVRVSLAGICNTDLEIIRGYMDFRGTLGHEMVGVVEEAPDPTLVGARVAAEINLACGACEPCRSGLGRHCPRRTVLGILGKDGCFAERVTLPVVNLHRVPEGVPDEAAVFVEPLAAAHEILEQVRVERGTKVLVLGDGKLGLLCAMALLDAGAGVVVVGKHERKLAIAEAAGAATVPLEHFDVSFSGFDVVVEATGSPAGLDLALERVRPRGTVVLKSTFHGAAELDTARIVIDEISVVGSRCGPFAPAVESIAAARVDPRPLVDATYPFAAALAAVEHARRPGALKVVLDMRA